MDETSVTARARLQPVSSAASSGSSKYARRLVITDSRKPPLPPRVQASSSVASRSSVGQRPPLATTDRSSRKPMLIPPSASTSLTSPSATIGLPSRISATSNGNTRSINKTKVMIVLCGCFEFLPLVFLAFDRDHLFQLAFSIRKNSYIMTGVRPRG